MTYSRGRIAGLMEAAGLAESFNKHADRAKAERDVPYCIASAIRAAAEKETPDTSQSYGIEPRSSRLARELPGAAAEKEAPSEQKRVGFVVRWNRLPRGDELSFFATEREAVKFYRELCDDGWTDPDHFPVFEDVKADSPSALTPLERELYEALKAFVDGPEIIPDSSRFMGFRTNMDELRANARAVIAKAEKKERGE